MRRLPDGIRLVQTPVQELTNLRDKGPVAVKDSMPLSGSTEIVIDVSSGDWPQAGVRLFNAAGEEVIIGVNRQPLELFVDRQRSRATAFHKDYPGRHSGPVRWRDGKVTMRVLFDCRWWRCLPTTARRRSRTASTRRSRWTRLELLLLAEWPAWR